jgi:hypothetical protein
VLIKKAGKGRKLGLYFGRDIQEEIRKRITPLSVAFGVTFSLCVSRAVPLCSCAKDNGNQEHKDSRRHRKHESCICHGTKATL